MKYSKTIFSSLIVVCLVIISTGKSSAQLFQKHNIEMMFKDRKEIYFRFTIHDKSEIHFLTSIISIDNVKGNVVYAYANKREFQNFIDAGYKHFKLLKGASQLSKVKMMEETFNRSHLRTYTAYPTYPIYEQIMQQYATDYPALCHLVTLGTLPSGRKIMLLKISENVNTREYEPQFLYTSTMHGDETAGYIDMLNLIQHLLENYGSDAYATSLINNIEIWICPLANPDGTFQGGNNTVNGAIRYNDNGVDLNRNYPDPQDGAHPDGNAYQPETQLFMGFADTMDFAMAANFHGGSEVVNYPWDTWNLVHADTNWWQQVSQQYADSTHFYGFNGYFTGPGAGNNSGVTDGYEWYEVNGGRQDYMNWYHHCREFTVELSNTKILSETDLDDYWNYNKPSLLAFMNQSRYGIKGLITDACTGNAIKAEIFVNGHDYDSSNVYTSLPVGNYHRPIHSGTYSIAISAPGYQSVTINNVVVSTNAITIEDAQLQPIAPVANFIANTSGGCDGVVSFSDLSGSSTSWNWDFGDGTNSAIQNPIHFYDSTGSYTVILRVENCAGQDSITITNAVNISVVAGPTVMNDTANCGATSLTLIASASGQLRWFDQQIGGNLVASGNSFSTPLLNQTTTFFVESSVIDSPLYVGPIDNSIGTGGAYTGGTYHYLVFDAMKDFELVSVWVSTNVAGSRTIQLQNSSGTTIQSITLNIPTGASRVTLHFTVPMGTGFRLGIAGGHTLYRNQTGGNYPYILSNVASIYGNSANNLALYYYFYNWEIATHCSSMRIPVTAFINNAPLLNATVTADNLTICPGNLVNFNVTSNDSIGTLSYQWLVNGVTVGNNSNAYSTVLMANGDLVSCVITTSDSCAVNNPATSNSISINVDMVPVPVVSHSGIFLVSTSSSGYQWYFNSLPLSDETNDSLYLEENGNYFVVVTDANGCTNVSATVTITNVGIEIPILDFSIIQSEKEIAIYNNSTISSGKIFLMNEIGQTLRTLNLKNEKTFLNISTLPSGIYFLNIKCANRGADFRFVVLN